MSALDAAVTLAEASGWSLTNLEIQKLLYMAQMNYMGEHAGAPLFHEDFQAWKLGPVVPSIYKRARDYGSGSVRNLFHNVSFVDAKKKKAVLDVYQDLKSASAWDLVAITHWQGGAWAKNFVPGKSAILIPKTDIMDEYRARLAA